MNTWWAFKNYIDLLRNFDQLQARILKSKNILYLLTYSIVSIALYVSISFQNKALITYNSSCFVLISWIHVFANIVKISDRVSWNSDDVSCNITLKHSFVFMKNEESFYFSLYIASNLDKYFKFSTGSKAVDTCWSQMSWCTMVGCGSKIAHIFMSRIMRESRCSENRHEYIKILKEPRF